MSTRFFEMNTELCQQSRYESSCSNLLVLVRWSVAAPPLVNPKQHLRSFFTLIQRALVNCGAISSQVFAIKAELERGEGAYIST